MRRLFSLLFSLVIALQISAQTVSQSVTFDFLHPETLNPSIDMNGKAAASVLGADFTDGPISISFATNEGLTPSIRIDTDGSYYLNLYRANRMTVKGHGVKLTSFKKGDYDRSSGLNVIEGQPGSMVLGKWTCDGDDVYEVTVENFQALDAMLTSLTVTYEAPQDILSPVTILPASGDKMLTSDFAGVVFTFDYNVSSINSANCTFTNVSTGASINASTTISGKKVTVKPLQSLSAGTYTLTVDEGAFRTYEGFYNKAFSTSFKLSDPQNTFNPVSLPDGQVEKIPSSFELVFPGVVGNFGKDTDANDLSKLKLPVRNIISNETVAMASFALKEGNTKIVVASLTPSVDITTNGVYTLSIPEKCIYNIMYTQGEEMGELWNAAINMEFRVGTAYIPSDDLVRRANEALALSGLGYPTVDASERTALQNALNAALNDYSGSDDELNALIDAFNASTNVTLPEPGRYYIVANVAKNGTKRYLKYADNAVSLTTSYEDAARFFVTKTSEGKYVFEINGMYLHTLINNNRYVGTTTSNVLPAYIAEFNDITLARLVVNGVDNSTTLGKFSMYGAIGRRTEGGAMSYAYSLVDTSAGIVDSDADGTTWYNDNSSSAFILTETTEPDPSITYTISPANGSNLTALNYVTITINNVTGVSVDGTKSITLTTGSTSRALTNISVGGDNQNVVTIVTSVIDDGMYTLYVPKGALTYTYNGRKIEIPAISAVYNVTLNDKFTYDFDIKYPLYTSLLDDKKHHPSDFNNFYIYTDKTEFFINDDVNSCTLIDYDHGGIVAEGKLEKGYTYTSEIVTAFYRNGVRIGEVDYYISNTMIMVTLSDGTQKKYIINSSTDKLQDEEIRDYTYRLYFRFPIVFTVDNLRDSRYGFIVTRGSYGDSNFGLYLTNPSAVTKSECHLNEVGRYYLNTSINAIPTGINEVKENTSSDDIYDISGRKVLSAEKPGMYIKNGKKFIVK